MNIDTIFTWWLAVSFTMCSLVFGPLFTLENAYVSVFEVTVRLVSSQRRIDKVHNNTNTTHIFWDHNFNSWINTIISRIAFPIRICCHPSKNIFKLRFSLVTWQLLPPLIWLLFIFGMYFWCILDLQCVKFLLDSFQWKISM